jgi:hypothetical protein
MTKIVQEKFQVDYPQQRNDDAHSGWASDKSARTRKALQTRASNGNFESFLGDRYNRLPPGQNIDDQELADIPREPYGSSLETGTQVTDDVTTKSLREGFDRKKILSSDDEYTREHNDAFYDTVEVDGVEGYVERNNMLDRM